MDHLKEKTSREKGNSRTSQRLKNSVIFENKQGGANTEALQWCPLIPGNLPSTGIRRLYYYSFLFDTTEIKEEPNTSATTK